MGNGKTMKGLAALVSLSAIALAAPASAEDAAPSAPPLEVVCVAGCNGLPPRIVQRLPVPPVKSGAPIPEPRYVQVVDGLWCAKGGGCYGLGEPPTGFAGGGVLAVFAFR